MSTITRRRGRGSADEKGMTLIELLVAMALTSVVLSIVMGGVLGALRTDQHIHEDSQALEQLRNSMRTLTSELREARLVYATSDARTIVFWVDANRDSDQDLSEQITWAIAGTGTDGVLTRTTAADIAESPPIPPVELAEEIVVADAFTYEPPIPNATVVGIRLSSDVAVDSNGDPRTVETELRLRNAEKTNA